MVGAVFWTLFLFLPWGILNYQYYSQHISAFTQVYYCPHPKWREGEGGGVIVPQIPLARTGIPCLPLPSQHRGALSPPPQPALGYPSSSPPSCPPSPRQGQNGCTARAIYFLRSRKRTVLYEIQSEIIDFFSFVTDDNKFHFIIRSYNFFTDRPHGWPLVQLRVLHELIYSARRMGQPLIAVR